MNGYALWLLTRRNLKIFLKDKANVFFSLLAPLIVKPTRTVISVLTADAGMIQAQASSMAAQSTADKILFISSTPVLFFVPSY